jgi:hypothetical protein
VHVLGTQHNFLNIICTCYVRKGNYVTPNTKNIVFNIGWQLMWCRVMLMSKQKWLTWHDKVNADNLVTMVGLVLVQFPSMMTHEFSSLKLVVSPTYKLIQGLQFTTLEQPNWAFSLTHIDLPMVIIVLIVTVTRVEVSIPNISLCRIIIVV